MNCRIPVRKFCLNQISILALTKLTLPYTPHKHTHTQMCTPANSVENGGNLMETEIGTKMVFLSV